MKKRIESGKPLNLNDQINAIDKGLLPEPLTWPTPRANSGNAPCVHGKGGLDLQTAVGAGADGQLNPDWVEALMGYPQGWTDIDIEAPESANFPAAWLGGSWEAGIPRVTGVKKSSRVHRLKGLGNAVVPQIPELLWRLIMEAAG
jgi:hypothetical protein